MDRRGFTLAELIIVLAIGAMLMLAALPALSNIIRSSQLDGAVRKLVSEVRHARTRATMTGWEFRLVGFSAAANTPERNQYRLLGRSATSVAWPGDLSAPLDTPTQFAGNWIDVNSDYPGTRLVPGASDPRFELTFNSRGAAADNDDSFGPFQVVGKSGDAKAIRVSAIGGISLE